MKISLSLADWDLHSDRNQRHAGYKGTTSLADWDLHSDRNAGALGVAGVASLADWDLHSDRNPLVTYKGGGWGVTATYLILCGSLI